MIAEFKIKRPLPLENSSVKIHSIILTQPDDEIKLHKNENFYVELLKYYHVHNIDQHRLDTARNAIFYPREDIHVVRELTPYLPYNVRVKRKDDDNETTTEGGDENSTTTDLPFTPTTPKLLDQDEYGKKKMTPCVIISSIAICIAAIGILYCLILIFLLNVN